MTKIIDMEIAAPKSVTGTPDGAIYTGRPGTPFADSVERPTGYGFSNYSRIFGPKQPYDPSVDDGGLKGLVADMDAGGVEFGLLVDAPNSKIGPILQEYPTRFRMFATMNPMDGMRAVREFERLVREDGASGLRVSSLYNCIPANDRRYYPLYAKCVELGVPVRIYASMNYANDRPYDLGHPRYIDDIAIDFPELKIVAGLAGWPWVTDMVGLLRRHPNLYCDTSAHRPKYFSKPGSGWDMFCQFGDSLLQDKVMVGLSRYLFNTPFQDLAAEYQDLPLKEKTVNKWLYGNAKRFFAEECVPA